MSLELVSPVVTRVDCGGASHSLRWADGELAAVDHPDVEAERALTALGGQPCRCVQLLDAWERCREDPRALVLGPRAWEVTPPVTDQLRRPGPGASVDPLLELLGLGGGLPRRLVASVAAALAPRAAEPALRAQMHAALYGRLRVSLSHWLGSVPELELTVAGTDETPSLMRNGAAIHARLPISWLVDVWSPGLDVVWGRFTLAATPDPQSGISLLVVDELMTVNVCTLSLR